MRVTIRPRGISSRIEIPQPRLTQPGLVDEADLTIENGALVVRKPELPLRAGWADAAKAVALVNNDELLLGELSNVCDEDLAQ